MSFDANPSSGVSIYDSWDFGTSTPWMQLGGTSLSAPAWAGLIAIADQGRVAAGLTTLDGPSQTLPLLYSMPSADFHDIITGDNGTSAGPGYDLVTGRGSPNAPLVVRDLIGPFAITSTSPAAASIVSVPPTEFGVTFTSPCSGRERPTSQSNRQRNSCRFADGNGPDNHHVSFRCQSRRNPGPANDVCRRGSDRPTIRPGPTVGV